MTEPQYTPPSKPWLMRKACGHCWHKRCVYQPGVRGEKCYGCGKPWEPAIAP